MPKDYSGQPETADGYSVVANEYLEALYNDPLVELRTRIRFYIQRWTWGYGVKTRDLSQARMAKEIGAHRSHLNRAIKELVASKRINVTRKGNKKKLTFSINKYYRQWIDIQPDVRNVTKKGNVACTKKGNIQGSVPIICKEKVSKENTVSFSAEKAALEFDKFWSKWSGPKRDKKKCRERWINRAKNKKLPGLEVILQALEDQVKEREVLKSKGMFVPQWKHPFTWINGDCWEDEPLIGKDGKTPEEKERDNEQQRIIERVFAKNARMVQQASKG